MKKCGDFIDMLVSTFEIKDFNRINYVLSENHTYASLLAGIMMREDKQINGAPVSMQSLFIPIRFWPVDPVTSTN